MSTTRPRNRAVGVGDAVGKALAAAGVTEERVNRWLGRPCGCKARREKLNALGYWAARVLSGRTDDAADHLDRLIGVAEKRTGE